MNELATRVLSGVALIALALFCLWLGGVAFALLLLAAGSLMLTEWIALSRRLAWGPTGWIGGALYVGLPLTALLVLRETGLALPLWTLAVVWATDIFAFFAGRAIGGPKIAPAISPSKTWAGLGGGMAGAALTGGLLAQHYALPDLLRWLGAPMAVLAQAGDFFESWMKRRAGVKDSGTLIPGHGGALDRLDGLVPVAAAMGALLMAGALS